MHFLDEGELPGCEAREVDLLLLGFLVGVALVVGRPAGVPEDVFFGLGGEVVRF